MLHLAGYAMPNADDVRWFKEQFHSDIEAAVAGTPFDLDMMTALACQETGEVWPILRRETELSVPQIVALCVGDTLDSDRGRNAFPKTKADLVAAQNGPAMFDIARKGSKTELRFTHVGLVPEHECFDTCSNAWGFYINNSLRRLITTGKRELIETVPVERSHRGRSAIAGSTRVARRDGK